MSFQHLLPLSPPLKHGLLTDQWFWIVVSLDSNLEQDPLSPQNMLSSAISKILHCRTAWQVYCLSSYPPSIGIWRLFGSVRILVLELPFSYARHKKQLGTTLTCQTLNRCSSAVDSSPCWLLLDVWGVLQFLLVLPWASYWTYSWFFIWGPFFIASVHRNALDKRQVPL